MSRPYFKIQSMSYSTPVLTMNYTFHKPQQRLVRAALSNTFGFGGHNACIIVKKFLA